MISPKKAAKKMEEYAPPKQKRKGKLRLDFNENTLGCSPKVIKALKKIDSEEIATYPKYEKFIQKLSSYLKVSPKEILLTNGADEALQVVVNTYLEKGQEVIFPVPTFSMFQVYASLAEAQVNSILYNKALSFPTEKILREINDKTKLVILANPNNPTGTVIKERDLKKILKKAKNSLVVIDEAYWQFYGKSFKNLIQSYDNLVVIQTFSKAFGLAGLRLGYIIAPEKIIKNLKKVISPYSVNTAAIIAGSAALDDLSFVENYVQEVKQSKILLENGLKKLGIKTYPSQANFLLANFGNNYKKIYQKLKKKEILVRDRSSYPLLKNCLRITLGTKEQTQKLIKEIKNIVREKILLFDLDGVLVDTSQSYRVAIKKTAEFFTKEKISFEKIQEFKQKGGYNDDWDLTQKIISEKNIGVPREKTISKFQEFYVKNRGNEEWLLEKKILKKLYKKYKLGVVTGRPREEALFALEKFNVKDYFDTVIAMEDVGERKKPHPYGINLALEKLGEDNALYFGDNVDDMKAAKNAGIGGVGVLPSGISSKNLKSLLQEEGAKLVIGNINKIEKALK